MPRIIASKYRVDDRIGEGGMGVVFAGHHLELNSRVAIKELQPRLAEDPGSRARFLREARLAASIEGEHCARIFDVGTEEDGMPYLVMEYLAGESLDQRLKKVGTFSASDAATIMLQLLAVLAEAHSKGLVHRDLKPSNLFLVDRVGDPLFVKVLDFGISKEIEGRGAAFDTTNGALTEPRTLLGSPEYMSPEQLRDSASVDVRTDLWACGVLLYELLSGRKPFSAKTLPDLYAKILGQDPNPLRRGDADLPPELVRLIEQCLAKEASGRPSTSFAIAKVLAPFAAESARSLLPRIRAWSNNEASSDEPGVQQPSSTTVLAPPSVWSQLRRSAPSGVLVLAIAALLAWITGTREPTRASQARRDSVPVPALLPVAPTTLAAPLPATSVLSATSAVPSASAPTRSADKSTGRRAKEQPARIQTPDGIELIP